MADTTIEAAEGPAIERRQGARPHGEPRAMPVVRLLVYYAAIIGAGAAIINLVPGGHHLIAAPIAPAVQEATDLVMGRGSAASAPQFPEVWPGVMGRFGLALVTVLGALAIALQVAWVHMLTRRLRYSPSLVHTMVMLPIVVAGVVLVVKNSLALAFALAGIVAGVRFRQKLSEPKEAVYVLLSLGIGLAAGVQALDIALSVSLAFNVLVLVLWRWDLGSLEGRGSASLLAIGDPHVLAEGEARREVHRHALRIAEDMETDGILVVHGRDADTARHGVEITLIGRADEWRITRPVPTGTGTVRFEVVLRLASKTDPIELLGELEERWAAHIQAAEYIPFRRRIDDDDE
jgi:hypothetical protein